MIPSVHPTTVRGPSRLPSLNPAASFLPRSSLRFPRENHPTSKSSLFSAGEGVVHPTPQSDPWVTFARSPHQGAPLVYKIEHLNAAHHQTKNDRTQSPRLPEKSLGKF